ncbi:HpcH/HpaI aldolase family protein [Thalassomonas sp. M1454]|uniref:HpcH/HpaI aldolase family protein n=1 Tax=Thalassomonas sp. M1454 TaxID=2594477 RepID=UPI00117FA358|nr:aldolase/citrate lyase family protein [Thalassomonas sp. M1454]TRX56770.1 aldolase [Thalassomonas sp. M1454]
MLLKQKIRNQQPLLGTFIKTTHYHNTEVLALSNLDLLCLDAEHAPFDRSDLDQCVLAAKANNKPVVIRVPDANDSTLLNALDIGADGVVLPHIKTAKQAIEICKKCFFGDGGRGFAGSTRFAQYTTAGIPKTLEKSVNQTCVIAQIEDLVALDEIDQICQIDDIDCIFIGRIDLTISLGQTNPSHPSVVAAVETIVNACNTHNKACGMFVGNLAELPQWKKLGVSLFLLGSDHNFLLSGANTLRAAFDNE